MVALTEERKNAVNNDKCRLGVEAKESGARKHFQVETAWLTTCLAICSETMTKQVYAHKFRVMHAWVNSDAKVLHQTIAPFKENSMYQSPKS